MRVIITGGGTGGHLYPALAIAEHLEKENGWDVHFVGTTHGLEAKVVPLKGYPFHTVWIAGLQRGRIIKNLLFPLKMGISFFQACVLLMKMKPGFVVGTGGYVSWPVLAAATFLRIPAAIQEQNQAPGLVTRLFASKVEHVYLSFESSKAFFRNQKVLRYTGNPTRDELDEGTRDEGITHFGLDKNKTTLFVFGGSQGSKIINETMVQLLPDLMVIDQLQILWGTGPRWLDSIAASVKPFKDRVHVLPYIDAMNLAYRACDFVVCRSGATTVAEITRIGLPAIFIPFHAAAGGHQEENARALKESGAARMILEAELKTDVLKETIIDMANHPEKREAMCILAKKYGRPEAARIICDYLTERVGQ